jgi:hypothetical protein
MGNSFNKAKTGAYLRSAQARMNIHRSKKLARIAKIKDDIIKHLIAGNEINAKIWAETLISEEGMIPCYDVISSMCDQLNGRLTYIEKFGPPEDMKQTFATLIHAAPKMDCEELMMVRKVLVGLLDQEFAKECDTNYALLNPVIAENIDMKKCDEGQVILRLVQLAKEKNVDYIPSQASAQAMHAYCLRKGIPPPGGVGVDAPVYAPIPDPKIINIEMQGGQLPPGYNPGHGTGGMPNPGYGGQPPAYMPPQ